MWDILLALAIGIAYGYFTPGRQDKKDLFKKAALIGFVIALILALIAYFTGYGSLGGGIVGAILGAIIYALLVVGGAWIGDWLEHRKKPAA